MPTEYGYADAEHVNAHNYLLKPLDTALRDIAPATVFDLGCGNGSVAKHLSARYSVVGIDASESGIAEAKRAYPEIRLDLGSAYDDLAARYGQFDAVVSLEVVEHLFDPRLYARRMFDLVKPGGAIVVSTPYHGYIKNLVMAATGKLDAHFTALWDGGHIKFWSVKTLSALLTEAGFTELQFNYAGRVPALAKSMIVAARRPA
jgi:2-polyprenyl-3-methyl-5-hydroxy-6-metoxy-1,4-benzoquinol methylase